MIDSPEELNIIARDGNTQIEIFRDKKLSNKIRIKIKENKKDLESEITYYAEEKKQ